MLKCKDTLNEHCCYSNCSMYILDLAETLEGMSGAFIIREDETEMATCTQNIAYTTGKKTTTLLLILRITYYNRCFLSFDEICIDV